MNLRSHFLRRRLLLSTLLSSAFLCATSLSAQVVPDRARPPIPTLTVTGRGEAFAAPDAAVLQLGAVAEDTEAAAAQKRVNEILQRALKTLRDLKLPENKIKTAGLSLTPVYEQADRTRGVTRSQIVGYRAHNTLQVEVVDLTQIGRVIDAGVAAGANQIENLSFQLRDDLQTRKQALRLAVEEARSKAQAIAETLGIQIKGVHEVTEGGVHIVLPRMEISQARFAAAPSQPTPVEPGEIRVEASVTIHYAISDPATERR